PALVGAHAAGVGEDGVHVPAALLQPRHAEAGVEAAGEGEDDVVGSGRRGHGSDLGVRWRGLGRAAQRPASVFITAFCTCRRLPASCTAMQRGESITASVALTLRRSGRQWLKTPSRVSAIFRSSTMKCLYCSRIGFSGPQLPKYGSAPQLLA